MTIIDAAPMLTTRQVVEATGVTVRQLNYWIGWGVLKPITAPGKASGGSGARFLWDDDEIRMVKTARFLLSAAAKNGHVTWIASFMGGNWQEIRHQVSAHRTGWLHIASDGQVRVTEDPVQLYRWQAAARVSITVNLGALA